MNILSEIGWSHKPGGAIRVATNGIFQMAKLTPHHKFFVLSSRRHPNLTLPNIFQTELNAPILIPQVIWDQFLFPHLAVSISINKIKPDVVYFTNNIISYKCNRPIVVLIHDMTPFILPDHFQRLHGIYQRTYFKLAVKRAKKIITVSKNSKKDICEILNVPTSKVTVAYPAANFSSCVEKEFSEPDPFQKFNIDKPFILYVGAIHPRKNVDRLIKSFVKLKKQKKMLHQLVIAGPTRWMQNGIIESIENSKFQREIKHIGAISDQEIKLLYVRCSVFVYPSLYEGFGLPVLEAMSLGAPVVTSNTSSLPEVAGDAAELVDPKSEDEIAEAIWKIIDNPDYAKILRQKGLDNARKFSWAEHGRKVLSVIESAV